MIEIVAVYVAGNIVGVGVFIFGIGCGVWMERRRINRWPTRPASEKGNEHV